MSLLKSFQDLGCHCCLWFGKQNQKYSLLHREIMKDPDSDPYQPFINRQSQPRVRLVTIQPQCNVPKLDDDDIQFIKSPLNPSLFLHMREPNAIIVEEDEINHENE